jgi:hypothetical protein
MNSDLLKRLIGLLLACCLVFTSQADDRIMADKTAIQAAFLYNFALFTDWPVLPDDAFNICVIADDHILDALASVKNKRVKDRPIFIKRIESSKQARNCQVLFVGASEQPSLKEIAEQISTAPVLVVSEDNSDVLREAIILLSEKQNKISFKINRTEAARRSITFSSKLLNLATQVY